jgi:hypothetical protein
MSNSKKPGNGIGSTLRKRFETKPTSDKNVLPLNKIMSTYAKPETPPETPSVKINPIKLYNHVIYCLKAQCKDFERPFINNDKLFNEFVLTLSYYFANDERFLESKLIQNRASLKKALFIHGNYGFGKSSVLLEFQKLHLPGNSFSYKTSYEIKQALEDKKQGTYVTPETSACLATLQKNPMLIDELGKEGKSYGEETLVSVLNKRHELFVSTGKKTHFTSNLKPELIGEKYGFHIHSRLHESCNIIRVDGTDKRMI